MTHEDPEKVVATISDAKRMGIEILPPDVNTSDNEFSIEVMPNGSKAIRYGLTGIKNVGEKAVSIIKQLRPFTDFNDFCTKIDGLPKEKNPDTGKTIANPINKTVRNSLIKVGAFDFSETNRHKLLNYYNTQVNKDKTYNVLKDSEYVQKIKLTYEKELMGMYISAHPLDPFPYENIDDVSDGDDIEIGGTITKINITNGKKGDYATVIAEVKDGRELKFMLWNKVYEAEKNKLKVGEIRIFSGTINKQFNNVSCSMVRMWKVKRNDPQAPVNNIEMPVREEEDYSLVI